MGRGWSPGDLSRLRRVPAIPPFDLLVVAIIIAAAEVEIWVPSGACIGGEFPFGLCNFGESLGPRPVAVVYTTVAAVTLLGRRRWPLQTLLAVACASVLVALVWVASPGLGYFLPLLVAAYSVGRYHRGLHPGLTLLGAAGIVFATSVMHDLRVPDSAGWARRAPTRRVAWRAVSATSGATTWCRYRAARTSMTSTDSLAARSKEACHGGDGNFVSQQEIDDYLASLEELKLTTLHAGRGSNRLR